MATLYMTALCKGLSSRRINMAPLLRMLALRQLSVHRSRGYNDEADIPRPTELNSFCAIFVVADEQWSYSSILNNIGMDI